MRGLDKRIESRNFAMQICKSARFNKDFASTETGIIPIHNSLFW